MMREIWKEIKGYEGYYAVSTLGRVKSLARTVYVFQERYGYDVPHRLAERILKPTLMHGYPFITLRKEGQRENGRIHVLVLEAFVCLRPKGMVACHNDGNRQNNHLSNLRWDTQEGNERDTCNHDRRPRGARCNRNVLSLEQVKFIKENRNKFSSKELAEQFGVPYSTVHNVVRGNSWAWVSDKPGASLNSN